jgi:hypothetical protein
VIFYAIGNWWNVILGKEIPGFAAIFLIIVPLLILAIVAIQKYRTFARSPQSANVTDVAYLSNFLIVCGYIFAISLARMLTKTELDERMFSPVTILFTFMMALLVAKKTGVKPGHFQITAIALYVLWIGYIFWAGSVNLHDLKHGMGPKWYFDYKTSPSMQYVHENYKPSEILTSDPEPFWLWYGECPKQVPYRDRELAKGDPSRTEFPYEDGGRVKASNLREKVKAILWFKRGPGLANVHTAHRFYLIWPQDVVWDIPATKTEFPDGILYQLR